MKTAFPVHLVSVVLLALAGCHAQADRSQTSKPPPKPPVGRATATPAASSPRGAFYETYRGRFATAPDSFTLHLTCVPKNLGSDGIAGSYYGPAGHPFQLVGQPSSGPDSLVVYDTSSDTYPGEAVAIKGGVWRLRRDGGNWTGTRAGQPLKLRRVGAAPNGLGFAIAMHSDTVAAYPGEAHTPYGDVSLQGLIPIGSSNASAANKKLLLNILRELGANLSGPAHTSWQALWLAQRQTFTQDYRVATAVLKPTPGDTAEAIPPEVLRHQQLNAVHVLVHQPPLLSLSFSSYSYSGGVHGLGSTQIRSFDLRTGQVLSFNDIFLPEARLQLSALLERHVRQTMQIPADKPLDDELLVSEIPVCENVCLTPGGVIFSYTPYEIAAYADGEIRLFVPLAELRPWLREGLPLPARGGVAVR
ncbi:hypothetical protein GCM10022409_34500 [Hymenobacter glaciei]|uniref:DUF3298 domain-containing protein n=1 Tax=Hymenobacter glaciei TaxID=877209 RepID=A0ABP7UK00_9BACT